jgi:hypothetical protein
LRRATYRGFRSKENFDWLIIFSGFDSWMMVYRSLGSFIINELVFWDEISSCILCSWQLPNNFWLRKISHKVTKFLRAPNSNYLQPPIFLISDLIFLQKKYVQETFGKNSLFLLLVVVSGSGFLVVRESCIYSFSSFSSWPLNWYWTV